MAVAQTFAAPGQWEAVATATVNFVNVGSLPMDVDITNFDSFAVARP